MTPPHATERKEEPNAGAARAERQEGGDPFSRVVQLRGSLPDADLNLRFRRQERRQRAPFVSASRLPSGPTEILELLSPRQRQVLLGVLGGRPNKAIAFELGLSTKTVETHRARVMAKLDAQSLADLVRICTVAGIPKHL